MVFRCLICLFATFLGLAGPNLLASDCPTIISGYNTPGMACDMSVARSTAYVAECNDMFQILDLANVNKIKSLWLKSYASLCPTQTLLEGLDLSGPRVFLPYHCAPDATFSPAPTGLIVLDVTNEGNPTEHVTLGAMMPVTAGFNAVDINGTVAYMAAGTGGLHMFDISDPYNPSQISFIGTGGYAAGVVAVFGYAFVVNRPLYGATGHGISVVDVTRINQPHLVASLDIAVDPRRLVVDGNRGYLTDAGGADGEGAGLWVLDLTVPQSPEVLGFYATSMRAWGVDVQAPLAFVGLYSDDGTVSNMLVLDTLAPSAMTPLGKATAFGFGADVTRYAGAVLFGTSHGLKVLDVSGCIPPQHHHSRPLDKP